MIALISAVTIPISIAFFNDYKGFFWVGISLTAMLVILWACARKSPTKQLIAEETIKGFRRDWAALIPRRIKAAKHLLGIRSYHANSAQAAKPMPASAICGDGNTLAVLDLLQIYCAKNDKWSVATYVEQLEIIEPLLAYSAGAKELLTEDYSSQKPRYSDIVTVHECCLKLHPEFELAKDHFPDRFLHREANMTESG